VGILLTDGPADEYEHIWVTVTEVSLLPEDGCQESEKVVVFASEEGYRFDLLKYRDEDFLLCLKERVPAGIYQKIRLKVSKVEAEGGPAEEMEIKAPGGKIDLEPRQGSIVVTAGSTLYIRLDIDANKSINLHEAGRSGKCIFRPVVFVDLLKKIDLSGCPSFVSGEVKDVCDEDGDGTPEWFTLARDHACMGTVKVVLDGDTLVFLNSCTFGGLSDIRPGQHVTVKCLMSDGCCEAKLVIIDEFLCLKGTVKDHADGSGFGFLPDEGQEIAGAVSVALFDKTPVVSGCGKPVDPSSLECDTAVKVWGIFDAGTQKLYACFVAVRPQEISGTITAVTAVPGGCRFTILKEGGRVEEVEVTGSYSISLEGEGVIDTGLVKMQSFLQCQVTIRKGEELTEVEISSGRIEGEVTAIDGAARTVTVGDTRVLITLAAAGVDVSGDSDWLMGFKDIEVGDHIVCYGLKAYVGSTVGYYAFAFLVNG
jgi:cold shock CspA family protein